MVTPRLVERSIFRRITIVLAALSMMTLAAAPRCNFRRQVISVPAALEFNEHWNCLWRDVNGDGLDDLLAVSPSGQALLYLQKSGVFGAVPDATWQFPPQTAWFTTADLLPNAGHEIVYSTRDGVFCLPLTQAHTTGAAISVCAAKQVFGTGDIVRVLPLRGGKRVPWSGNLAQGVPLVFPRRLSLARETATGAYEIAEQTALYRETSFAVQRRAGWATGARRAGKITVEERYCPEPTDAVPRPARRTDAEKAFIERKCKELKGRCYTLNERLGTGTGPDDVILYTYRWGIDPKSIMVVFLRDSNGALPEKPSQVLRFRGVPVEWDWSQSKGFKSPFYDVNTDGIKDLVFVQIKNKPVNARSFVEIMLSEGVDFVISVYLGKAGRRFSNRADISFDIKAIFASKTEATAMIRLTGDFNADGRPDFLIRRRRSLTELYLSSTGKTLYDKRPAYAFVLPARGRKHVEDLNGDGRADLYVIDATKSEIIVFLSQ